MKGEFLCGFYLPRSETPISLGQKNKGCAALIPTQFWYLCHSINTYTHINIYIYMYTVFYIDAFNTEH